MSAVCGSQIGHTLASAKQAQKSALRAMSAARGALAGRTAASAKQTQTAALRTGGFLLQR